MKNFSIIIGLLAGLLFGLATPLCKLSLSNLNSFQLAGLLYLGAAMVFVPNTIVNGKHNYNTLKKSGKWLQLAGIIIFGGILGPLLLMMGLTNADSMSVSIWLNFELVATAVLGIVILRINSTFTLPSVYS